MKKELQGKIMDKLAGQLTENEANSLSQEMEHDAELKEEFLFFSQVWHDLEQIKVNEPSEQLPQQFYDSLAKIIHKENTTLKSKFYQFVMRLQKPRWLIRISFGLFLVAFGFILGGKFNPQTLRVNQTITTLENKASQKIAEKIPYQPAAARLNRLYDAANQNKSKVVNVLLETLEHDPNVNVKLAALKRLSNFIDDNKVKRHLMRLLKNESSPLVQVEMLNILMDYTSAKESIKTMEKMLQNDQLNTFVKQKIERDLPTLRASYTTY